MRWSISSIYLLFSCVDDKVCVVGIFGKDNLGYKSKAVHLNGTIGKEVFKVCFNSVCVFEYISKGMYAPFNPWHIVVRDV